MPKITPPFNRSPGNYDPVAACEECCVQDFGPSLTQQSQAEDADINTIVRRFGLTGTVPLNHRLPQEGDFTGITDYNTAMQAIARANTNFNVYPPNIRARFDNDPAKFVAFCEDKNNLPELRKLGLAPEETPPPPTGTGGAAPGAAGASPPPA